VACVLRPAAEIRAAEATVPLFKVPLIATSVPGTMVVVVVEEAVVVVEAAVVVVVVSVEVEELQPPNKDPITKIQDTSKATFFMIYLP
jgi:hypothetical protein